MPHLTQNPSPATPQRIPRARLTPDEKQRFNEVLDETQRVKDAAQAIGVSLPAAYQLAKKHGWASSRSAPSATRGKPKTRYTQEQKDAFFTAFDKLQNVSQAAREVNIPIHTCYQWVVKAKLKIPTSHAGKREEFLRLRAQGMSLRDAVKQVGAHLETGREWDHGIRRSGNKRFYPDGRVLGYNSGMTTHATESGRQHNTASPSLPALEKQIDPRYLSMTEREEIYALCIAGHSIRQIAIKLNRSPSTISRELRRNRTAQDDYYPHAAHRQAVARRSRQKEAKLACPGPLRDYVVYGLRLGWSPEQICFRLVADHPDDLEMRVTHETVYQSIFVQARGGLKREVVHTLRSGRVRRKPQKKVDERRSRFRDPMISISERPAEVEDRACLVIGKVT